MKKSNLPGVVCFLTFIVLVTPGRINAATINLSITELIGTYTDGDPQQTASFDFGVQFSSIQNATIEVTATGTAGLVRICQFLTNDCSTSSYGPEAAYGFLPESGLAPLPYGILGPFTSTALTYQDNLIQPLVQQIDFLLDGTGVLQLGHPILGSTGFYTREILTPSVFEISDVTLTVEGHVVPLPATIWLFGAGLLGLIGIARRRRVT